LTSKQIFGNVPFPLIKVLLRFSNTKKNQSRAGDHREDTRARRNHNDSPHLNLEFLVPGPDIGTPGRQYYARMEQPRQTARQEHNSEDGEQRSHGVLRRFICSPETLESSLTARSLQASRDAEYRRENPGGSRRVRDADTPVLHGNRSNTFPLELRSRR